MLFETYFPLRYTCFAPVSIKNVFQRAGFTSLKREMKTGRVRDRHNLSFDAVNSFAEKIAKKDGLVPESMTGVSLSIIALLSRNWKSVRATL